MSNEYEIQRLTRTRSDGSKYWSYCIVWWVDGTRKRHSLNTTDKHEADALARRVWASINRRAFETVGQVVEAYLDTLQGKSDERRKRDGWAAAKPFWGKLGIETVDEQVSHDYLAWRDRAVNTMRNELSLVRTALHWAERGRFIPKAPKIIVPSPPESSVNHLTKEQFRKFLEGCSGYHVKLFAMLSVATGGRKTAILQSKWSQVDFDRALIQLNPEGRTQNSKYRATVPLNDQIMPVLREARAAALTEYIIEYNGMPIADIKKGIAAASVRSGIKAHPHMFRHSAAVWMAEDRVPMSEIAAFLGHRDINVTIRVYARYHPDYLRTAARSLTW